MNLQKKLLPLIFLVWRDNYIGKSIGDYITDIMIDDIKISDDMFFDNLFLSIILSIIVLWMETDYSAGVLIFSDLN
jgi:predicted glycosyltransferase involved in capsule biosynthesis